MRNAPDWIVADVQRQRFLRYIDPTKPEPTDGALHSLAKLHPDFLQSDFLEKSKALRLKYLRDLLGFSTTKKQKNGAEVKNER